MGAFAGALGAIGQQQHEKNLLNMRFQHEVNQNISALAEHISELAADDETRALMAQAAADAAQGKKVDLSKVILQATQASHAREQQRRSDAAQADVESRRQPLGGPNGAALPAPNMSTEQGPMAAPAPGAAAGAAAGPAPSLPAAGVPTGIGQPGGGMAAFGGTLAQAAGLQPFEESAGSAFTNPAYNARLAVQRQGVETQQSNVAELQRQAALGTLTRQQQRQARDEYIQGLKDDGIWPKLSARQQAQAKALPGSPPITPELRPQTLPGTRSGASILAADADAVDGFGQPVSAQGEYRSRALPDGTFEHLPTIAQVGTTVVPDANSPTKFSMIKVTRQGIEQGRVLGATPPAGYAPIIHNGQHMQVVDFGDHKELIPIQTSSTTQRVVPGAEGGTFPPQLPSPGAAGTPKPAGGAPKVASLGGRVIGEKTLTPQQRVNAEKNLGAIDNTIEIIGRLQQNLPVLSDLISAKKIQLQSDPTIGFLTAAINRNVPMTDQEAQVAADFLQAREHINTLRVALGAQGFRSHEAWQALTGMAGNPIAAPKVTEGVLRGTMQALQTQKGAIERGLNRGKSGGSLPGPSTLPPEARAKLREGHETTFGNGQVWTLRNGEPVKVR